MSNTHHKIVNMNLVKARVAQGMAIGVTQGSLYVRNDARTNIYAREDTQTGPLRDAKPTSNKGELRGATPNETPNIDDGTFVSSITSRLNGSFNGVAIGVIDCTAYNKTTGEEYGSIINTLYAVLPQAAQRSNTAVRSIIESNVAEKLNTK